MTSLIYIKKAVIFRLSAMGDVALLSGVLGYLHEHYGMEFIVISRANFTPLFANHPAVCAVENLEKIDLKGKAYRQKCHELAHKYNEFPLLDLHANLRSRILSLYWKNSVYRYNKQGLLRRLFSWTKGRFGGKSLLEKNVPQRYLSLFIDEFVDKILLAPRIYLTSHEKDAAKQRLMSCFDKLAQTPEPTPFMTQNVTNIPNDAVIAKSERMLSTPSTHGIASTISMYNNTPSSITDSVDIRKKIVAFHPFASHMGKTLTWDRWLELAVEVNKTHHMLWIGMGESPEISLGINLINSTSLRELCGILSQCDLLITGDSGPMHLANGVDCRLFALFGPTCEEWGFFPVGHRSHILKAPCRSYSLHGKGKESCLGKINNEIILNTIHTLLE